MQGVQSSEQEGDLSETVAALHSQLDSEGAPDNPSGEVVTIESLSDDLQLLVARARSLGPVAPCAQADGSELGSSRSLADVLLPSGSVTAAELRQASVLMQARHDAVLEQLQRLEAEWAALKADAVATEDELRVVTQRSEAADARCALRVLA